MRDELKTKEQLAEELAILRSRIEELRAAEIECRQSDSVLRRREYQLEILSRTSQHINAVLEIPVITRTVVASAMEVVSGTAGAAGLYRGGAMVFTEYNAAGKLLPISYTFQKGQGVPGWIIETMKPYLSNDAARDPHVLPELQQKFGFYNFINVPILSGKGKLLGCIEIHNKENHQPFDAQDVFMLQGLAASAAVALENAQLLIEQKLTTDFMQERERFLSSVFSSIQDGISVLDKEMTIVRVNPTMEKWYAHAMPLVGKRCYEAYHGRDHRCDVCPTNTTLQRGTAAYEIVPKVGKDGAVVGWLDLYSFPMIDAISGELTGVIEYVRDISERKHTEEELKRRVEFERLITSISTTFVNVASSDVPKEIDHALRAIGEFVGADRSYVFELLDDPTLMSNTHEWCAHGVAPQKERLQQTSVELFPWFYEKMKKGETVYVPDTEQLPQGAGAEKKEFRAQGIQSLLDVPMRSGGHLVGFVGFDSVRAKNPWSEETITLLKIVGEIFSGAVARTKAERALEKLNAELTQSNKKLERLVLRDAHTGLYNHHYLPDVMEGEFQRARRYVHPLSVLMIDIDYFKSINDTYGHPFGDLVLKQFARQLHHAVRRYDVVIRYGGEEFIIISPSADRAKALVFGQRLLDMLSRTSFGNAKHTVKLKLSMAVVSYPEDKVMYGMQLVNLVDQILNKVKESGGNRVYSSVDLKNGKAAAGEKGNGTETVKQLKGKIEKLTKRGNQSLAEAIYAFAKTIEVKDHYTGSHVEQTVHYATQIAKALALSSDEIEHIQEASILHDLGKVGVSEKILHKNAKLTKDEYEEIKRHPQIGVDIIRPIQFMHDIIPLVLYHHERWDGKGYPLGLKGDEIPIGARIIAIADVYQALTSNRPYRKAFSKEKALRIIKKGARTQFDPQIVDIFLHILQKEPLPKK